MQGELDDSLFEQVFGGGSGVEGSERREGRRRSGVWCLGGAEKVVRVRTTLL